MKHRHSLTLGLLTLLLGCQTIGPAILNSAANLAGLGAQWAVEHYPDKRSQFTAAEQALTVWLDTGTTNGIPLDIAKLNTILGNLSLGQDGWGENRQLYLQGGLMIWDLAKGLNYMVTSQPAIRLVGTSIRDGFARGLAKPLPREIYIEAQRPAPQRLGRIIRI